MGRRMPLFLLAVFALTAGALLFDRFPPPIPSAAGSTAIGRWQLS